jgi:oligosaccharide repeat unit polymerase
MNPLTWFTPFIFLYSIAYPVLIIIEDRPYVPLLKETLFIEWVALLTFILVFGFSEKQFYKYDQTKMLNMKFVTFPVYLASFLLTLIYLLYIYSAGLSSKYAISMDNSIYGKLSPFFSIFVLSFVLLVAYSINVLKRIPKLIISFTLFYTLIALFIIGERDLFLRVLLVLVFLYNVLYKAISKKVLILGTFLGLSLVPIMGNLKNIALRENVVNQQDKSFLASILSSDFGAASRNLNTLINNKDSWSYFYGETFWWDIKVVLNMGSSPGMWFNKTFYSDLINRGGGNGFTLIGEGYMNFGIFGVILVFASLALFLKFLYIKATTNIIWLAIYVTSIPIVIYSLRADVATILTQISKHVAIPLLTIYIVKHILEKSKANQTST